MKKEEGEFLATTILPSGDRIKKLISDPVLNYYPADKYWGDQYCIIFRGPYPNMGGKKDNLTACNDFNTCVRALPLFGGRLESYTSQCLGL